MPARTDARQNGRKPAASDKPAVSSIDDYLLDNFEDPFASPEPEDISKKRKEKDVVGIDEEISASKRARVPRVKLDESRLLSENGIPKLRKRAKDLRLKGKGHEFSDATRLLSFYQLWLDDLFPKAQFLDALAMVEKAGHSKSMHKIRMDWINEGKPRAADGDAEHDDTADQASRPGHGHADSQIDLDADITSNPTRTATGIQSPSGNADALETDGPEEDELDALMAEAENSASRPTPASTSWSIFGRHLATATVVSEQDPEQDDLDALMAETEAATHATARQPRANSGQSPPAQAFGDEEEAMAELDGLW